MTYRTEPSFPHPTFEVGTPVTIVPKCVPSGENTYIPPGPAAKRLPFLSTFKPSGAPFILLVKGMASKNTRPFVVVPSSFTSNASQADLSGSTSVTYKIFSSGEKAMPFGAFMSLVSNVSFPSAESR